MKSIILFLLIVILILIVGMFGLLAVAFATAKAPTGEVLAAAAYVINKAQQKDRLTEGIMLGGGQT